MSSTQTIIAAAVITEGLLVAVAWGLARLCAIPLPMDFTAQSVFVGAAAAIPVLALNHSLWRASLGRPNSVYARFSREIIVPLCRQLSPVLALCVALMSGFAEELLFRGTLNTLFERHVGLFAAAVGTSVLFAYVHFVGNTKRFGRMIPLYVAVGLYLWGVQAWTGSLGAAMVTHGTYNFFAILLIRYVDSREKTA